MTKFYFRRVSDFCSCCTYNYKTIIIEANTLEEVKNAIVNNYEIRDALVGCMYSDVCEFAQSNEYEDHNCVNGKYLQLDGCFETEEAFYNALVNYYKDSSKNIIDDLKKVAEESECWGVEYMGEEKVAHDNFTKWDDPDHKSCTANGDPEKLSRGCYCIRGHRDFYGLQHFKDLNDTEYGIDIFTIS